MTKKKKLTQDGMIKELIRDYPEDALEFFEPDIYKKYGKPVSVDLQYQENKKHHVINRIVYCFPTFIFIVLIHIQKIISQSLCRSGFQIRIS